MTFNDIPVNIQEEIFVITMGDKYELEDDEQYKEAKEAFDNTEFLIQKYNIPNIKGDLYALPACYYDIYPYSINLSKLNQFGNEVLGSGVEIYEKIDKKQPACMVYSSIEEDFFKMIYIK